MTSLALARDGCSLLVNLQSQTIHLWDLSNPAVPRATAAVAGPSSSVRSLPPHPCRRNSSRVFGLRPPCTSGCSTATEHRCVAIGVYAHTEQAGGGGIQRASHSTVGALCT